MTEVQVQGARVTQLRYDHAVTVLIGDWCLRIEEPFLLRVGRAEWLVDPESGAERAEMLGVLDREVRRCVTQHDGSLALDLDAASLRVPASEDYEAWTLTGPHGVQIVSLPGGGLATWGAAT
jgi:hypothetical protein